MASQGSDHQTDISIEVNSEIMADSSSSSSKKPILKQDGVTKSTYDSLAHLSLTLEVIKEKLILLVDDASAELHEKASSGSPLWGLDDLEEEQLDKEVYNKRFMLNNQRRQELTKQILGDALNIPVDEHQKLPLIFEASRASKIVRMKPIELVNMFMDVDQWLAMFSNVVSRATSLGKIIDDENTDESLLVMNAEFCLPTAYPVTRECYFVRRSKKVNERTWLVVDASLDLPGSRYLRKPSGCLIEKADGDLSKVTIVEHNELMDDEYMQHVLFRKHVSSGFAFRASRWITMLRNQTEYQHLIYQQINDASGGMSSLLRLARRMSQTFLRNINSCTVKRLEPVTYASNIGQIIVSTEYFENYLGRPDGKVISVATSVRLPFNADKLYDSLQCPECHPKWDIAILGASAKKELHILIGEDPSNHVSVLNIKIHGADTLKCLQACFTDTNGMYIVWTFIKTETMNAIMAGEDADAVGILVSGAVVLPWDPLVEDAGSILTASFESLDESGVCLVRKDAIYSDMTKTISLLNDICTTPYEGHGCDDDDDDDASSSIHV